MQRLKKPLKRLKSSSSTLETEINLPFITADASGQASQHEIDAGAL